MDSVGLTSSVTTGGLATAFYDIGSYLHEGELTWTIGFVALPGTEVRIKFGALPRLHPSLSVGSERVRLLYSHTQSYSHTFKAGESDTDELVCLDCAGLRVVYVVAADLAGLKEKLRKRAYYHVELVEPDRDFIRVH